MKHMKHMKPMKLSKLLVFGILTVSVLLAGCVDLKEKVHTNENPENGNHRNLPELTPTFRPSVTPNEITTPDDGHSPPSATNQKPPKTTMEVGLLTSSTSSTILTAPEFCKNEINWRYTLEKSVYCAINQKELSAISRLALELKGESIQESAWNILELENDTISYDWRKASLPPPRLVYWSDGRVEVVEGKENVIQTPTETIQRKRGICSDYAILTVALLLEMGYRPVYIFDISSKIVLSAMLRLRLKSVDSILSWISVLLFWIWEAIIGNGPHIRGSLGTERF